MTRSVLRKLRPISRSSWFPDISIRSLAVRVLTNSSSMSCAIPAASDTAVFLAQYPLSVPESPSILSSLVRVLDVRSLISSLKALCSVMN